MNKEDIKERDTEIADDIIDLFYSINNELYWDGPKIVEIIARYRLEVLSKNNE